jgi:hypothetical protein
MRLRFKLRLSWANVHLLMIKDLLWQFLRCKSREPCPCKYVRNIQIPQQHVPLFATWSQVTTNEAKARLMQHKSDRNRTLQSTHPCAWSYHLYIWIIYSTCFCMHLMLTLFPRQPMMPEPMHETSRWWMSGLRLLLTHTDVNMPTICLLLMHLKPSPCIEPSFAPLFVESWFNFALSSLSFLLSASPISEFHFADAQLFLGPRTFLALSGTISWNLKHHWSES